MGPYSRNSSEYYGNARINGLEQSLKIIVQGIATIFALHDAVRRVGMFFQLLGRCAAGTTTMQGSNRVKVRTGVPFLALMVSIGDSD
jgi:hypothetical protein